MRITPFEGFWLVFCLVMILFGIIAKAFDEKGEP